MQKRRFIGAQRINGQVLSFFIFNNFVTGGICNEYLPGKMSSNTALNLMHQTAHHRRNRAFYPLMNEGILGKLFFDALIVAVFLYCPYFRSIHQNRVVGLVLCFELAVQRSFFHVLVVIGLKLGYKSMAQGELGNTKFGRLTPPHSVE